jgi:hypothetical protein
VAYFFLSLVTFLGLYSGLLFSIFVCYILGALEWTASIFLFSVGACLFGSLLIAAEPSLSFAMLDPWHPGVAPWLFWWM